MRPLHATLALCLWLSPTAATAPVVAGAVASVATDVVADERAVAATARLLDGSFRRYETRHFVVLSDAGVSWTRSRAALLERTRDQFLRAARRLDLPAAPHRAKLLCVLFDDHARYAAFARAHDGLEASWVGGYFATPSNRIVFYNDLNDLRLLRALARLDDAEAEEGRRGDGAPSRPVAARSGADLAGAIADERRRLLESAERVSEAKTIHEAVHLLAFNTGVQRPDRDYPFWLNEGLATSFETDDPGAAFGPEHPSPGRDERLADLARAGALTPIDELIALRAAPADDVEAADAMYHAGYALFGHLYRHDRAALGALFSDYAREPAGPVAPERHRELFRRRFGDPQAIQRRLATELNEAS